jgi:arsenate reductase (thioredoxin)
MYRVLLLCKDNSVLSPMAEGYLKLMAGDSAEVCSAGVQHPKRVSAQIIKILNEDGIDISGFTSHSLQEYRHIDFDYILTFDNESELESQHLPSKPVKYHYEFDDLRQDAISGQESLDYYRTIREKIKKSMRNFVKEHLSQANAI